MNNALKITDSYRDSVPFITNKIVQYIIPIT